jgi:hypothetical protein
MKRLTKTLAKTKSPRLFKMNKRGLEFCVAVVFQPEEFLVFHLSVRFHRMDMQTSRLRYFTIGNPYFFALR